MFINEMSLWTMPLLAITLIAKKAYCQIKDIISSESNKEIALLKDELT
jgi:hypothetical protein